jgi:hypothetical protein
MSDDGADWIGALPAELAGQRSILRRLREACLADDRIRWLAIGCSLGRGNADRLSDLDLALGLVDEQFEDALPDMREMVAGLGELIDSYHHLIAGVPSTHERIFAQYADRCQVDLVVFTASEQVNSVKDVVVLYDPDGWITPSFQPRPVTAEQVREWAFGGWCALADFGKYLRRGSSWEALDRLHEARSQAWKLWGASLDVPNPQYGLTSILDFAPGRMPPGMAATVGDLDPVRQLVAASALAGQLAAAGSSLAPALRAVLPGAMAEFVTSDLAKLSSPG